MNIDRIDVELRAAVAAGLDPEVAAEKVAAGMTAEAREVALVALLAARVVTLNQSAEARHAPSPQTDSPQRAASKPRPSSKVALIRDAWAARLDREEFYIDGQRVALRDMTAAACLEAAAGNRVRAAQFVASATRLERLAAAIAEHGVTTVGDLPSEVGLAIWRAAA